MRIPFAAIRTSGSTTRAATRPARGVTVRGINAGTGRRSPAARPTPTATTRSQCRRTPRSRHSRSRACARHSGRCRAGTSACATPMPAPVLIRSPTAVQLIAGVDAQRGHSFRLQCRTAPSPARAPRRRSPILDTVYQGRRPCSGVAPNTNFPALDRRLGRQQSGRRTFFDGGDASQHIALLADLTEDTDEFDQHVIAHEFGHYIEYNFSRADNIGGSHGLGDKLDPRVAFGEGFGYAFAAIVLNDPVARDTSSTTAAVPERSMLEHLQHRDQSAASGDQRRLRLLVQRVVGVVDPLGHLRRKRRYQRYASRWASQPIWNVLINEQRTRPRSRPSSASSRRSRRRSPASAAAIDTLVAAQNITAAGHRCLRRHRNAFSDASRTSASRRCRSTPRSRSAGPVIVRRSTTPGTYNKLGNHRFIRFMGAGGNRDDHGRTPPAPIRMTSISSSTGIGAVLLPSATDPPAATEVSRSPTARRPTSSTCTTAPTAATPSEGTPGDYDLTVTIN